MDRLSDGPVTAFGSWCLVADTRDVPAQSIRINSNHNVAAYALDAAGVAWHTKPGAPTQGAKRPDAVVIGRVGKSSVVCFIELKVEAGERQRDRAIEQLEEGIRHFHPQDEDGKMHHEQWKAGDDELKVRPASNHVVYALLVAARRVVRPFRAHRRKIGDTEVHFAFCLVPGWPGLQVVDLEDLLEQAGIPLR